MRAANRSYRTSAAAGSRRPNDRISESSGRFSFDRTRSTVLGRSTHGNRARLCWTVVGRALFDVGPDVLEDERREVLIPPDHEVPLVEVVLSGNPPPGDEGERGRPAIDEGVRLLVLRRRLSCGQAPVPAPLAHAFQVHLDALPGEGQAGQGQGIRQHPDAHVVDEVDRPVLEENLQHWPIYLINDMGIRMLPYALSLAGLSFPGK